MKVKTKDLYCTFVVSGENVADLSQEFLHGQANANLAAFKLAMNQLKEMMFDLLNNAPSARRTP